MPYNIERINKGCWNARTVRYRKSDGQCIVIHRTTGGWIVDGRAFQNLREVSAYLETT